MSGPPLGLSSCIGGGGRGGGGGKGGGSMPEGTSSGTFGGRGPWTDGLPMMTSLFVVMTWPG